MPARARLRCPQSLHLSKNRHGRFRESDLLRRHFETVLQRCIAEGLVGGEGFAIDASLIKADANRQKGIEGEKGVAPEATGQAFQESLAGLDDAAFGAATEVVPSSSRRPIRRHAELERTAGRRSLLTPPTI